MTETKKETVHMVANNAVLEAIARVTGFIPTFDGSAITQISAEIAAEKKLNKTTSEENLEPGELMKDGTIFVGRYTLGQGKVTQTFNIFAAPEDLKDKDKTEAHFTYAETYARVAGLEKWHGYNGAAFTTDAALHAALQDGSYDGGWVIPTVVMQRGETMAGVWVSDDNLFAHLATGSFANPEHECAFTLYWTCTANAGGEVRAVVSMATGVTGWKTVDSTYNPLVMRCRPVRLVEIPSVAAKI